jgi:hypothetical protein
MKLRVSSDLIFILKTQKTLKAFIVETSKRTRKRVLDLYYDESVVLPPRDSIYITLK